MPFDAQSGARLRAERERLNRSQQEMADAVGVRREMWSKYERGVAVPGGDVCEALVHLEVDLSLVLTGEPAGANRVMSPDLPPDEQLLLEAYRGMKAADRKTLLATLLTGGKSAAKPKPATEGGIKVSGTGHRVAGHTYNERKE